MNLPDVKALKKLLELLRAQGVLQYQTSELNLVLTERAPESIKSKSVEAVEEEEELSPEQEAERLLFYSATHPTESKES